jgi:alanine racemase
LGWRNMVGNRWVEIDTDAIRYNYQQIKNLVGENVQILAVVKADAYGLGAVESARVLEECGAAMLAVTTVDEGIELRQGGISAPILLLSPFFPEEAGLLIQYELTPAVSFLDQVRALAEAGASNFKIHLKIETGMGRTGLYPSEVSPFLQELQQYPGIEVEGVFTHFAQAGQGDSFTRKQFAIFQQVVEEIKDYGIKLSFIHACNSAATLDLPEMHCNMVRIGTLLFGQCPHHTKNKVELRNPWQVKARIIHVKNVEPGTSVGYGREFIARKKTRLAVIPMGWADGLTVMPAIRPKNFLDLCKMVVKLILEYLGKGRQTTVLIGGQKYPLVGRLGMQLSTAEVDQTVKVGDEAQLSLRRLSANPRLPRVYFKDGQAYAIRMAGRIEELRVKS